MAATDNAVARAVLAEVTWRLAAAGHGGRGPIVRAAAESLGITVAAVYAALKRQHAPAGRVTRAGAITSGRKRRADAGQTAVTEAEAQKIAGYLLESRRGNGKVLADLEAAVTTLRANGEIAAGRVDPQTGEFMPLSLSAINRALKRYRCHPGQLALPAPKVSLGSERPNQVWQIDPSLCVLYYLRREAGLRAMPHDEFYKNKPRNLARIEHDRVWRYVHVDHASGAFYVEYVLGAESGQNLCDTFINAMQPRGTEDPFHGVPEMVMVDPGSANTGAMFKALCAALGVAIWVNQPGQPWAKGSVEKHNDIIERKFEHRLKFFRVGSLAELNAAAWAWMRDFNARAIHSRHRMTRYAAWMTIARVRIAPAAATCRQLAASAPEQRTVNTLLRVNWRGRQYDVSRVPGVMVGEKLLIARNAWADADSAHVLGRDEHGRPAHYVVPVLARGEYGFTGAVPFGAFRAPVDTPADRNRRAVERAVMDAATDKEAAARRRARALPFAGVIDPMKPVTDLSAPAYLPRRGTPVEVDAPPVVAPRAEIPVPRPAYTPRLLGHVELAQRLRARVPDWGAAQFAALAAGWPRGATEDQLDEIARRLTAPALRAVP